LTPIFCSLFKNKDGPVPNQRLGQHSGQAECVTKLERRNEFQKGLLEFLLSVISEGPVALG
jgi:hypothetical protein